MWGTYLSLESSQTAHPQNLSAPLLVCVRIIVVGHERVVIGRLSTADGHVMRQTACGNSSDNLKSKT